MSKPQYKHYPVTLNGTASEVFTLDLDDGRVYIRTGACLVTLSLGTLVPLLNWLQAHGTDTNLAPVQISALLNLLPCGNCVTFRLPATEFSVLHKRELAALIEVFEKIRDAFPAPLNPHLAGVFSALAAVELEALSSDERGKLRDCLLELAGKLEDPEARS